jgi:enoyl-CoA hydratase/carnithine racemase
LNRPEKKNYLLIRNQWTTLAAELGCGPENDDVVVVVITAPGKIFPPVRI